LEETRHTSRAREKYITTRSYLLENIFLFWWEMNGSRISGVGFDFLCWPFVQIRLTDGSLTLLMRSSNHWLYGVWALYADIRMVIDVGSVVNPESWGVRIAG
jgi:hypothetical protein